LARNWERAQQQANVEEHNTFSLSTPHAAEVSEPLGIDCWHFWQVLLLILFS
jgi:hypothetical protein